MKKVLIVIVVLAIAGGGLLFWRHKPAPHQTVNQVQSVVYKKACDVFSVADARSILGGDATQTPSQTDTITSQKAVTTCLYSYDPGSFSDLVSASVLLQGSSAASAKQNFLNAKPGNASDVSGYGEAAYWDPNLGQLHILKGEYWVIITAGSGPLSERDQELPHKIADIIIKRL